MKKLTFTLLLLCGLCMAINAQSNQSVDANKLQKEVVTQQNNDVQADQNVVSEKTAESTTNAISSNDLKDSKNNGLNDINDVSKRRRSSGTPIIAYVIGGVIVAVIILCAIFVPGSVQVGVGV